MNLSFCSWGNMYAGLSFRRESVHQVPIPSTPYPIRWNCFPSVCVTLWVEESSGESEVREWHIEFSFLIQLRSLGGLENWNDFLSFSHVAVVSKRKYQCFWPVLNSQKVEGSCLFALPRTMEQTRESLLVQAESKATSRSDLLAADNQVKPTAFNELLPGMVQGAPDNYEVV